MTSNADTAGIAANQLFPAAKAAAAAHGTQPRSQLFAATTVPIRADSFRWERYPTVEVASATMTTPMAFSRMRV